MIGWNLAAQGANAEGSGRCRSLSPKYPATHCATPTPAVLTRSFAGTEIIGATPMHLAKLGRLRLPGGVNADPPCLPATRRQSANPPHADHLEQITERLASRWRYSGLCAASTRTVWPRMRTDSAAT